MVLSFGLDLGSTRIKAGALDEAGMLERVTSEFCPPLSGEGLVREGRAEDYLAAAEAVLSQARKGFSKELPFGVASQRSSLLLWDAAGEPLTPLISWQDRRATDWCRRNAHLSSFLSERTGLRLSPHYLGPKLAAILEADASFRRMAERGELLAGTLETYLVWKWSAGEVHRTDPTMAGRTLLFDVHENNFTDDLLDVFTVPRRILPSILPTVGAESVLPRLGTVRATIADQASGVYAVAGEREDVCLVTFGTGTFVLHPTGTRVVRPDGYLAGPRLAAFDEPVRFAAEGVINGGGATADAFAKGPTELSATDPAPDAFCVPDAAGLGAPHWRPELSVVLSQAAQSLDAAGKRRAVLEGLLFRVREIVDDLDPDGCCEVIATGGLSREPFVAHALGAVLGRAVFRADEPEASLLGAARLAAGWRSESGSPALTRVAPDRTRGAYLPRKYERWKEWLASMLQSSSVERG
jgi:glycerol kinase